MVIFLLMVAFILSQMAASGGDYFLTYWVNKEESRISTVSDDSSVTDPTTLDNGNVTDALALASNSTNSISSAFEGLLNSIRQFTGADDDERLTDIYIFSALTVATVVITLSRSMFFFQVGIIREVSLVKF